MDLVDLKLPVGLIDLSNKKGVTMREARDMYIESMVQKSIKDDYTELYKEKNRAISKGVDPTLPLKKITREVAKIKTLEKK